MCEIEVKTIQLLNIKQNVENSDVKVTAIFGGTSGNFNLVCDVPSSNIKGPEFAETLLHAAKWQIETLPHALTGAKDVTFNVKKVRVDELNHA